MGAWNTADDKPILEGARPNPWQLIADGIFKGEDNELIQHLPFADSDAHERQDAQYDVEAGEAAYMLSCGHALPRWSAERLRVAGLERWCGICSRWVEKAMPR